MDIIVDGYNLIGSDQGLYGALEPKRNWLIQRLSLYQKIKQFKVTVVFDGWQTGRTDQTPQRIDGVLVLYSELYQKADAVIIRLSREKGAGSVVITSDREIRNSVERFGAVAISSPDFCQILRSLDVGPSDDELGDQSRSASKRGNPNRLGKVERRRNEKLRKLKI